MSNFLEESILVLYDLGFFTIILPFVLIYVLVFGLLLRMEFMKREGTDDYIKYNAMISFCLAFFTIYSVDITESLPIFISMVVLLFVGLLVINMLVGFMGGQSALEKGKGRFLYIGFIVVYFIIAIVQSFFDWKTFNRIVGRSFIESLIPVIVAVAVFVGIIYFVVGGSSANSSSSTSPANSSSPGSSGSSSPAPKKNGKKPLPTTDNIAGQSYTIDPLKDIDQDEDGFGRFNFK